MSIDLEKQKLIDLCFSIGLTISDMEGKDKAETKNILCTKSVEEKVEWIAEQFRLCGFDTYPCGASWGVLKN